jgi:polysaccharide biosynthesis/export protein
MTHKRKISFIVFYKFLVIALFGMALFSCSGPLKNLTYMHNVKLNEIYPVMDLPESYRVKPNDQLYINVIGENSEETEFLNSGNSNVSAMGGSGRMDMYGYLVDENGNISYPFLGEIPVAGKTILEIRDMVQILVDYYVANTSVQVRLINRTFVALGEGSESIIPMNKYYYTIFEALGAMGGITDYGNRQHVKIIRETPKGIVVKEIDLTDESLLSSEFYYIQPNDVIYVDPNKYRVYTVKTLPWINQAMFATSIASTFFLLLNLFK